MFLVAVLVLLFLMYRFYTFRAEMVFIMTLLTPAMLLIGAYHLTGEYREAGIFLLIVGIFLLAVVMFMYRITARGVEKEFRSAYYKNLFIYGALRFLQTFCRMTIVFSFVAAMLGGVSLDYKERLDIAGRKIYVDDNLRDAEGNQYTDWIKVAIRQRKEWIYAGSFCRDAGCRGRALSQNRKWCLWLTARENADLV